MNDIAKKERFDIEYGIGGETIKLNPTIVRKYLVSGRSELVTDTEIVLFMQICRFQRLNPFLREIYLIKYSSNEPAAFVTGKDTFTKRAAQIPECLGYNAGVTVRRKDGTKKVLVQRTGALVLDDEELVGGWAKVFRKGWQEPVMVEVSLKEYMRYSAKGEPTKPWRTMAGTLIRKVALVQGLREAFADWFERLYSQEEMPIDSDQLPTEPIRIPDSETITRTGGVETVFADPEPEPEDDTPPEVLQGASRVFDESGGLPSADSDTGPELF